MGGEEGRNTELWILRGCHFHGVVDPSLFLVQLQNITVLGFSINIIEGLSSIYSRPMSMDSQLQNFYRILSSGQ